MGRDTEDLKAMPRTNAETAFDDHVRDIERRLKGVMGFAARHLGTGRSIGVKARARFPMASTYKIPMAGLLLSMVDRGDLTLQQMVEVTQRHFDETGDIAQSVSHPGVSLSVANLAELMITQSNNNATDRVLELVGGPPAVTNWLRSIGVEGMRVDTSVNELLRKFYGLPDGAPSMKGYLAKFPTEEERERANGLTQPEFDEALPDTTSPVAMVDLLEKVFEGDALTPASRDFLYGVMGRCQTGQNRIRGQLPPRTLVAHKTGTIGGTVNDAGVIELPAGGGRVAVAIYTKGSEILRYTEREHLIGEIARSIYDFYLYACD